MFELICIKEVGIIAEQLQVVTSEDGGPHVKWPESKRVIGKRRMVDICWLSFLRLLLTAPLPSPELSVSISKWLQVNEFHPWLFWEHVTKAKPIKAFHAQAAETCSGRLVDLIQSERIWEYQDSGGDAGTKMFPPYG